MNTAGSRQRMSSLRNEAGPELELGGNSKAHSLNAKPQRKSVATVDSEHTLLPPSPLLAKEVQREMQRGEALDIQQQQQQQGPCKSSDNSETTDALMRWRVDALLAHPQIRSGQIFTFNQKSASWSQRRLILAFATDGAVLFLCAHPHSEISCPWSSFKITHATRCVSIGVFPTESNRKLYVLDIREQERTWRIATESDQERSQWLGMLWQAAEYSRSKQPPTASVIMTRTASHELPKPVHMTKGRARGASFSSRVTARNQVNKSLATTVSKFDSPESSPRIASQPSDSVVDGLLLTEANLESLSIGLGISLDVIPSNPGTPKLQPAPSSLRSRSMSTGALNWMFKKQ